MASVGTKNTKPEMAVRRFLHRLGYRFRLHSGELPGSPDIVFKRRKKVVFVHGCYWHGHGCRWGRLPKSNTSYWSKKIAANVARDRRNIADLDALGWQVEVVWQCDLKRPEEVEARLVDFLGPTNVSGGQRESAPLG